MRLLEETALNERVHCEVAVQVCRATFGETPQQEIRQTSQSGGLACISVLRVELVPVRSEVGHIALHFASIPVLLVRIAVIQWLQPTGISVVGKVINVVLQYKTNCIELIVLYC